MTMNTALSRALRRVVGTSVMVFAGHAGSFLALQARPDLPPPQVDRVQVVTMEGTRTITHRATIDRVLAIVRSHPGEWTRFPETVCLLAAPTAELYQGTVRRGVISWGPGVIHLQDRHGTAERMLSARDGAELRELLER
ncbi:MAG TPA: hypothetical protein VEQ60_19830 [Longimicrobium sp.]|nr:hypothetical protein [Longimicrobium sp.]